MLLVPAAHALDEGNPPGRLAARATRPLAVPEHLFQLEAGDDVGQAAVTIVGPTRGVGRAVTRGHDDRSRGELQGLHRPGQIYGFGRGRADLLANLAGAVLKIEAGLRIHRIPGVILGYRGGEDCPFVGRGAFFVTEPAVYAALGVDHLGLLRQNQAEEAVFPGAPGQFGVRQQGDSGFLEEGLKTVVHQAGPALLAGIGGLAAEVRRPAPEERGFFHQGHVLSQAGQFQGGADPGNAAA